MKIRSITLTCIVAIQLIVSPITAQPDAAGQQAIRKKADELRVVDKHGRTPLMNALMRDRPLSEIIELIEAGADVNQRVEMRCDEMGYSAVNFAARFCSNPDAMYVLSNYGADLESRGEIDRATPLMQAARENDNPDVFSTLVSLNADIYARNYSTQDSFYFALTQNPSIEVVQCVINTFKVADTTRTHHPDPLIYAVQGENIPIVKYLLSNGSNPNVIPSQKNVATASPLLIATKANNAELSEMLIKAGADPNLPVPGAYTPLSYAAAKISDQSVLRLLLKHGADPNRVTNDERTNFMVAASYAEYPDNLRLLIEHGADTMAPNQQGWRPIHYVAMHNARTEVIDIFFEHGANIDERTLNNSMTPLMICIKSNIHDQLVAHLLELGADVNAQADQKVTPIFFTLNSRENIAKLLIEHGAEINHQMEGGITPLMMASLQPQMKISHLLLDAGADPKKRDDRGRTALDYARNGRSKDSKLILRLEQAMADG